MRYAQPVNTCEVIQPNAIAKTASACTTVAREDYLYIFSSVKLTVFLLALLAATVLLGAWCPQISQVGQDKVVEQFGQNTADLLIKAGIADIFHSAAFLLLIACLTINIIMGSFKHVFPKLKLLRLPMPWLEADQISKLPVHKTLVLKQPVSIYRDAIVTWLSKRGYRIRTHDNYITAESGKFGRLAPTVTHIGLLSLLGGLIVSSWTGFSGFKPAAPGESFSLADAQHSQLWLGTLPNWLVKINETHREDYDNGETKQWYSNISIVDKNNQVLKNETISVNNPLSYQGVDIYQSSWTLKALQLRFNNRTNELGLQPMGKLFAAFLPLPDQAIIIFSVRDQHSPLRIFAKRKDWSAPKFLTQVLPGHKTNLGGVLISYDGTIAQTGLQYKCDPGLPIVFFAFAVIIAGISLAAVPHRQIWAQFGKQSITVNNGISAACDSMPADDAIMPVVTIGGATKKGKQSFAKQIHLLMECLQNLNVSHELNVTQYQASNDLSLESKVL